MPKIRPVLLGIIAALLARYSKALSYSNYSVGVLSNVTNGTSAWVWARCSNITILPPAEAFDYVSRTIFPNIATAKPMVTNTSLHGLRPVLCAKQTCLGDSLTFAEPGDPNFDEGNLVLDPPWLSRTADQLEAELISECVLWNECCKENHTEAVNRYFAYRGTEQFLDDLQRNLSQGEDKSSEPGWWDGGCPLGEVYCTPRLISIFKDINEWKKTAECSALNNATNCCGSGKLSAGNVDIYYWPEPEADTSCLNIIGNEILPIDHGVTRIGKTPYWGCTTTVSSTVITITTASLTTVMPGHVTFKAYQLPDPEALTCPETATLRWTPPPDRYFILSNTSASSESTSRTLRLNAVGSGTEVARVSTAVSGSFTFTSPFIYAHFTSISASDDCRTTLIPSTMLTFTSGELSTYAGILAANRTATNGWYLDDFQTLSSVFDFGDLPCPPASVALNHLYRPYPGEPYRPQLVLPDKLKNMNDWFKTLEGYGFTGFDPPHSLVPATQVIPEDQADDPKQALPAADLTNVLATATPKSPSKESAAAMVADYGGGPPVLAAPTSVLAAASTSAPTLAGGAEVESPSLEGGSGAMTSAQKGKGDLVADDAMRTDGLAAGMDPASHQQSGQEAKGADPGPNPSDQEAKPAGQATRPTQTQDSLSPQPRPIPDTHTVAAGDMGLADSVFQEHDPGQESQQVALPSEVIRPPVQSGSAANAKQPQRIAHEGQSGAIVTHSSSHTGGSDDPSHHAGEMGLVRVSADSQLADGAQQDSRPASGQAGAVSQSGEAQGRAGQGQIGGTQSGATLEEDAQSPHTKVLQAFNPSAQGPTPEGGAPLPQRVESGGATFIEDGVGDVTSSLVAEGSRAQGVHASKTMTPDGRPDANNYIGQPQSGNKLPSDNSGGQSGSDGIPNPARHDGASAVAALSGGQSESDGVSNAARQDGASALATASGRTFGNLFSAQHREDTKMSSETAAVDAEQGMVPLVNTAKTDTSSRPPTTVTNNDHEIKPLTGAILIEGQILTVGAPPVVAKNGDMVSLGSGNLIVGSSTVMRGSALPESNHIASDLAVRSTAVFGKTGTPVEGIMQSTENSQAFESGAKCVLGCAMDLRGVVAAGLMLVIAFQGL